MRQYNADFVKFHEQVSVRSMCAAKFNHCRKGKKMKSAKMLTILVLTLGLMACAAGVSKAAPVGTAFTYQGRLMDANHPADGLYDIAFVLFDAPEGPNEIYATGVEDLDVIDGYFTVELDFGSRVFEGNRRWLEAAVRPYDSNDPRAYISLSPRIELTPAPYALYAKTAGGDNDWMLSGNDMYSLPSGNVGIGKSPSVKLDVDGDININSAYKIKGDTVLSTPGGASIFVGVGAGENTTGYPNTFVGDYAGYANTTGTWNTFVGSTAGYVNTTGSSNTFLGDDSGYANTTGSSNTFVGSNAGCGNTTGSWNTFLGDDAGYFNNEGYSNTFIGYYAGYLNTAGSGNVFIGFEAGIDETGSNKLYIANGRYDPNVLIYGDFSTGRVGIGTTSPSYELDVEGNIFVHGTEGFNAAGEDAIVHLGHPAHNIRGEYGTGVLISAYNAADALTVREGSGNVGIGTTSPQGKLDVNGPIYQRGSELHADYVFEQGYELESIDEHSEFMWKEKHLPAIPKAMTNDNGQEIVEVGSHRKGIVEELEKAHIYIEQLHKQNKELEKRLVKLEAMITQLAGI